MSQSTEYQGDASLAVAIVGMAVRVPGAEDVETFWRNLREGVESIRHFTDDELRALGVPPESLAHPQFVRAAPVLDRPGRFDAAFFGYVPREAEVLDPQHRVFLECAWTALEHAGYAPGRIPGATAVFAGSSLSSYLLFNLLSRAEFQQAEDTFPAMVANDKDFLATRVAYHLDLKGPALTVQTGCSTSLVATHLACQSLLGYQSDVALAGGVSVHMPQRTGYVHQEGGITSPDGHCRAFDAKGQGTLFGSGAGVVVLKRLEDALADGDTIHAVIRGSAINNDGSAKVGFVAPSVEGQTEVITRAQAMAEVAPDSISYVETHGTATQLGDPVEVEALTQAFRAGTEAKGFCGIGSVKTNVGHLDAAAGVTGLIKTTLALEHRELPPSLYFESPNPRIDFANSPFYVNAALKPWESTEAPRRAGVSSFGIGGTNAHVILEEAPATAPGGEARPWQVLPLSAKTPSALEASTSALLAHLEAHPEQALADVAWTLQVGRKPLEHRRVVVCQDRDDALQVLASRDPQKTFSLSPGATRPSVVFMFPGGGAQYAEMGRGLYASEPVYREAVDRCCELLRPKLGFDLRTVIHPDVANLSAAQQRIKKTSVALPALFTVEYATARLWEAWGVKPEALIGHSLGEYAAACLAGVFSLEDALALVVKRGQLFEELPGGGMLSVPLPEAEVLPLLGDQLSVAAVNGAAQCAVAGTVEAIEALAAELTRREVEFRHIQIDVAAHSHLVEPLLGRFQAFVAGLTRNAPSLPFVSNVTGTWITPEEAVDPVYWTRHLRQTVRFSEGVAVLREQPGRVFLEVGPGRTLSTLVRLRTAGTSAPVVLSSVRHPQDPMADDAFLAQSLGRLWTAGVDVDWSAVHHAARRLRVPLPTYAFEGQDYWLAPEAASTRQRGVARKGADLAGWFYLPAWRAAPLPLTRAEPVTPKGWLLFVDSGGVGQALAERLRQQGHEVTTVEVGSGFSRLDTHRYAVDPRVREDIGAVLRALKESPRPVEQLVHLWSLDASSSFDEAQERGFYSVLRCFQALTEVSPDAEVDLTVVGREALEVESADTVAPERATLPALCKVIPQEQPSLTCRYVDARGPGTVDALLREVTSGSTDPVVAWRGRHRHVQQHEALRLEADSLPGTPLKQGGVYLITGGLGGVGLLLADALARRCQAKLVLVGRAGLKGDTGSRQRAVQSLEAAGAQVLVLSADVADEARMREVVAEAEQRFGPLSGVIHAAGLAGDRAVGLLSGLDAASCAAHFRAKAHGTLVLERVLAGRTLNFVMLLSSNASVLGGLGLAAYGAANAFLDAFAASRSREGARWLSTNWDGWPVVEEGAAKVRTSIDQFAMSADEAIEAFRRVVEAPLSGQVVVSTGGLDARLAQWLRRGRVVESPADAGGTLQARPALGTDYVPPANDAERTLAQVWQEMLGLEQLGVHDNFFDLGGNSLLWLKIVGRLKRELGRDVPLTSVFEAPTVAMLAKKLAQPSGAAAEAPVLDASQNRGAQRRERRSRRD
ncbi:type I polyketide synthase [Comamonas sp. JC664]|uniref:type I polyketide synthase n=1 Tax=Comamonas sp. JC664 TaxID=2801917 RepID=UPI00174AD8B7|nr:type I polyketide synthase [Comamonas sp. JC664]MBL0696559.1 SDR family NAD(P)-dependent oxidoreductase [Comamonas sp. JC664]GHG84801.1 polyketide synthase [Comamonas sp. KCTC 72670]